MAKNKIPFHDELRLEYVHMWTNKNGTVDEHMVGYCMGTISNVVKMNNGLFAIFKKPTINKDFPIAEGMTREMDEAIKICDNIKKSENHFISSNLRSMNEELKNLLSDDVLYYKKHRVANGEELNIATFSKTRGFFDEEPGWVELSEYDRYLLIEAQKEEIDKFKKRLQSYLKRFGMKNIRTWTYWDMA